MDGLRSLDLGIRSVSVMGGGLRTENGKSSACVWFGAVPGGVEGWSSVERLRCIGGRWIVLGGELRTGTEMFALALEGSGKGNAPVCCASFSAAGVEGWRSEDGFRRGAGRVKSVLSGGRTGR